MTVSKRAVAAYSTDAPELSREHYRSFAVGIGVLEFREGQNLTNQFERVAARFRAAQEATASGSFRGTSASPVLEGDRVTVGHVQPRDDHVLGYSAGVFEGVASIAKPEAPHTVQRPGVGAVVDPRLVEPTQFGREALARERDCRWPPRKQTRTKPEPERLRQREASSSVLLTGRVNSIPAGLLLSEWSKRGAAPLPPLGWKEKPRTPRSSRTRLLVRTPASSPRRPSPDRAVRAAPSG